MRVLVVEDEPRFANTIAEGLRDQGMAVDVAYDGLEAASKLNLTAYEVIVLDRDLPGIHGDTLCRMVTDSDDPAMILMLTAAGTPAERVAGLMLGADDYLAKPFHFPELVLRVRALARRKPAHDRTLKAAGIELDPLGRTVSRDGRRLDLSAKEFAVLESLLKASPGALSAERLLVQAWDENADPFTNTVRVTIGRLRRKLGEPHVIQNTPGIGYRVATTDSESAGRGDMGGPDTRLATYGTLAPGRPNHGQLAGLSGRWLVGHVRGSLVEAGWGAELGYPGLLLDADGPLVQVDVFESSSLPDHWQRLDAFEGPGYRRVAVDVSTAEGGVRASIYVLAETISSA